MQGTILRNFHILRGLANYHAVHLLSFSHGTPDIGNSGRGPLAELCAELTEIPPPSRTWMRRFHHFILDSRPDLAHRLRSTLLEVQLKSLLAANAFELVQVEGLELAHAIPIIRQASPESKIVFDNHNAEAQLQHRAFLADIRALDRWPAAFYSLVQARRLRRYERSACLSSDGVSVVSEEDKEYLKRLAPRLDPVVVPNCIDVRQYQNLPEDPDRCFDVIFIGKMDYRPNVDAMLWFGEQVWPNILRRLPGATWAIVGQKPHRRLERLTELPGVTVTGRVPRVQPYLASGRVYVMPFRIGSGTRLKLIEALAAGKAIVSTTLGAEGIPVENGKHLLLADDPDRFTEAVLRLLSSNEERQALARSAERLAETYDWRRVVPRFNVLYSQLVPSYVP